MWENCGCFFGVHGGYCLWLSGWSIQATFTLTSFISLLKFDLYILLNILYGAGHLTCYCNELGNLVCVILLFPGMLFLTRFNRTLLCFELVLSYL